MKFSFHTEDATKLEAALVGLVCFEEGLAEGTVFQALDRGLGGLLSKLTSDEQFKGKKGQSLMVHTHGKIGPQRVLLVGAGARKDFQPAELRAMAARIVREGA